MKKSVPVTTNLVDYFNNPCPVLSDNNSRFILEEISKGYDWVVEYGMGASTLYFLKGAEQNQGKFISIENNYDWFEICVHQVKDKIGFKEISRKDKPWSLSKIKQFTKGKPATDAPDNLLRFPLWSESFSTGPFFRLSPKSKSRFSGRLGPLWPVVKPIFELGANIYYGIRPERRPYDAEWRGTKNNFELILRNVGPSIKDQYGEAPNRIDYINAGLDDIRDALNKGMLVRALFLIDGGPRHKIVQEILSLEDKYKNFKPTIILCDAWRSFYHDTLAKRPSGKFIAGTNKTFKGEQIAPGMSGEIAKYWTGGDKTGDELAKQEIWVYQSA